MSITAKNITGFRAMYQGLKRAEKWELKRLLGYPAKASLHRWMNDPGSMRLEKVEILINYFSEKYPDVSVKTLSSPVNS